jgi:hypothetical protein
MGRMRAEPLQSGSALVGRPDDDAVHQIATIDRHLLSGVHCNSMELLRRPMRDLSCECTHSLL